MRAYSMIRLYAVVADRLIRTFWLPVLTAGLYLFWRYPVYEYWQYDRLIWAAAGAVIASAGLYAGGALAKAVHGTHDRAARIRVRTGGAKLDFLLAGGFLTAAYFQPYLGDVRGCLILFGPVGLLAGLVSLWCMEGYGGEEVLSELLGCREPVRRAFELLLDPERRSEKLRSGGGGTGEIVFAAVVLLLQLVPLLLGIWLMEVIACELYVILF
ncbi:MAG: hypothetical protein IJH75_00055 [Mogibacterium sp.]|nr:hypothetical protein [Mogibacterium sp.]